MHLVHTIRLVVVRSKSSRVQKRVKEIKDEIQGDASAGILASRRSVSSFGNRIASLDELSRHPRSHFTYHFTANSIKKCRVNVGTSSNGRRSVQGIASIRVSGRRRRSKSSVVSRRFFILHSRPSVHHQIRRQLIHDSRIFFSLPRRR
jgi:hypothetical protein